MSESFNIEKAIEELRSGKGLNGQEGILTPLIKQIVEGAMKGRANALERFN